MIGFCVFATGTTVVTYPTIPVSPGLQSAYVWANPEFGPGWRLLTSRPTLSPWTAPSAFKTLQAHLPRLPPWQQIERLPLPRRFLLQCDRRWPPWRGGSWDGSLNFEKQHNIRFNVLHVISMNRAFISKHSHRYYFIWALPCSWMATWPGVPALFSNEGSEAPSG